LTLNIPSTNEILEIANKQANKQTSQQTNKPTNKRNMSTLDDFHAGVTACLRSWSAFRTAAESGWGGGLRESQAKADGLRQIIFDLMDGKACPPPNFSIEDFADNLAIYMEEEFSITLEDNSESQVAEAIFKMYEGCCNGNPTYARQMVEYAETAVTASAQFPVQVQSTGDDDDDDEDMIESSAPTDPQPPGVFAVEAPPPPTFGSLAEYAAAPLFGSALKVYVPTGPVRQLGDTGAEVAPVAEVDDDGFAPVKPKARKR
jgi:pre-rRNA-processing protein TSR2